MFKSSKKGANKKNAIVSLLLVATLVITGALAFLTAKDNAENKFTVGNVDITLTEPEWDKANPDGTLENIVAGQVIAKDPTITNTGRNDAYVYMMVQVPKADEIIIAGNADSVDDYQLFSYTINDGWTLIDEKVDVNDANNYYLYAYNTALAPEGTATLFNEVTYAKVTSDFEEANLSIEVTAYAIQSDFYNGESTDAESAWALYANQNSWKFPTNLAVAHYTLMSYDGTVKEVNILTDDMTTITLPSNALTTSFADVAFVGWADETGAIYNPGEEIIVSSLYITDPETEEIINPNPVIIESVSTIVENENAVAESELPVKLIPKNENSSIVIDRGSLTLNGSGGRLAYVEDRTLYTESYVNILDENTGVRMYGVPNTEYNYEDSKTFYNWWIYGVEPGTTVDELFGNYITVQGDGYMVITAKHSNIASTGSTVKVYDRNGTDDTADDELVESFDVVVYGDINGDGKIDKTDSVMVDSAVAGYFTLSNGERWTYAPGRQDECPAMHRAGDFDVNSRIIVADSALMDMAILYGVDQTTGVVNES